MKTSSGFHRRTELKFSVDRLPAREELLLKSLIRVLDHRTHHHWTCVEQGADLRITTDPGASAAAGGLLPIWLGDGMRPSGAQLLELPLHADQIESHLNRLGDAIVLARKATRETPPQANEPVLHRLRQWPSAALLDSNQRLHLAALLSARALSVLELHTRSGVPLALCNEFVDALQDAGLIEAGARDGADARATTLQGSQPGAGRAAEPGLLARIRIRLGLQLAW